MKKLLFSLLMMIGYKLFAQTLEKNAVVQRT